MDKIKARTKRAKKTRMKIRKLNIKRLSVHRTIKHIYAQIFDESLEKVLVSASTSEKIVQETIDRSSNIQAAKLIGKILAERAQQIGIDKVAFDRCGYKYHGRVKAVAVSARENGLVF